MHKLRIKADLDQKIKYDVNIAECDNMIDESFNICTNLSLLFVWR